MKESQNSPSTDEEATPNLHPAYYPDSLTEIAQNAKVVLNFQHKAHTKDQLRGAYCAFSLPQGSGPNSPWNNWEPPSVKKIKLRQPDQTCEVKYEVKWGELRNWICEFVLCDARTGKPIEEGGEERVQGFMHYRERESGTTGNAVMLGMAWRESDMYAHVGEHRGVKRGRAYLPRFEARYLGGRVEVDEGVRPGFFVYGEPFEVVGDEEEVAEGDGKYDFRDLDEKDWWWRINRDDVRKRIIADPDHNKQPLTASVGGEQAPQRRIKTIYLKFGRRPYYEDIEANLDALAADESSSPSSISSSLESSYVSEVSDSDEPDYIGMLDSGMLPELFASDGDGEDDAVVVRTTTSSEFEAEHGSRLFFHAEWRSDHLTALNSHYRSR